MKKLAVALLSLLFSSAVFAQASQQTINGSVIRSATVDLTKIVPLQNGTLLCVVTGANASPAACPPATAKALLAITAGDVAGLAPSATTDTTNANNLSSGTVPAARLPALTGDCSTSAGSTATTCSKTGGVSFAPIATSGSASDLTTGTVPLNRLPAGVGGLGPIVQITGAAYASSSADLNKSNVLSNAGLPMTITLPSPSSVGAGKILSFTNGNFKTGIATFTGASFGTTASNLGTGFQLNAGASVQFLADATATFYVPFVTLSITPSDETFRSIDTTGDATIEGSQIVQGAQIVNGVVQFGTGLRALGGSLGTPLIGEGQFYSSAANGWQLRGSGTSNDGQILNSNGSQVCVVPHGQNGLACQEVIVNGNTASGNGMFRPSTNFLGFFTNSIYAGGIDPGQYWVMGASPAAVTISLSGGCGTGATVDAQSNNMRGRVTIGTSHGTSCTVNLNRTANTAFEGVGYTVEGAAGSTPHTAFTVAGSLTTSTFSFSGDYLDGNIVEYRMNP